MPWPEMSPARPPAKHLQSTLAVAFAVQLQAAALRGALITFACHRVSGNKISEEAEEGGKVVYYFDGIQRTLSGQKTTAQCRPKCQGVISGAVSWLLLGCVASSALLPRPFEANARAWKVGPKTARIHQKARILTKDGVLGAPISLDLAPQIWKDDEIIEERT